MKYASNTSVSSDRSRSEIEKILSRYGATEFGYATSSDKAMIGFRMLERRVRFILPMPDRNAKEFTLTPGRGRQRSDEQAFQAWEQATRQRWRALALAVKAKLEAVESGIATFEEEFLNYILLPGGKTVGEMTHQSIAEAYQSGKVPSLLGWSGKP